MVYTNEQFPNNRLHLPKPPAFLTWVGMLSPNMKTHLLEDQGKGQVRHHNTLYGARKYIKPYIQTWRDPGFRVDWALYEWDEDKRSYTLLYSGKRGGNPQMNPMYTDKIKKGEIPFAELTDDLLQETFESIAQAVQ